MKLDDPGVVFCIEPFASLESDGGEKMGRLLARLIRDPDHGFVVATTNAFIFAFAGEIDTTHEHDGNRNEPEHFSASA